ncbi:reverse transcriptase [Gossypium australe]|uniref:Reverse transcriptase n=1 Tax=Gossypium australe TaxID=47621 RepID=A0A5B6VPM8_9ROSI|nr:reverse transcriptase [Gossypium australe]
MDFCEDWISLIIRCVTSVSYIVVINEAYGDEFRPTRGLRQGDPLNPYLCLICAEGFSQLLDMAKRERKFFGAKVGRSGISMTHLLFADDSVLFEEASIEDANIMKNVINEYETVSR